MKIILSIDGGGIKGIIPATILTYLEQKIQVLLNDNRLHLCNLIDFIAGTSTGSIIGALMLIPNERGDTSKYNMSEISDFYLSLGDKVFKTNLLYNLKTCYGLFGPRYQNSNIEQILLNKFDHFKLKDLIKPCMFSGYDIEKRKIIFYTNTDLTQKYNDFYVKDIVRGSTSIPSYFSPAHFNVGTSYNTIIDGGLFANNPSFATFIEISKSLSSNKPYNPQDIMIISLGTGYVSKKTYNYKKVKNWGKAEWVVPIIDILISANSEITDYQINKLFSSYNALHNYKRLNPKILLASPNPLDASKENLINLIKDAKNYIEENKEMLDILAREICDINFLFKKI